MSYKIEPRKLLAYLLIASVFFEGHIYTFYLSGMRVRMINLVAVAAVLIIAAGFLMRKYTVKTSGIDVPISGFLAINAISLYNSLWFARGMKILLLLISVIAIYYITLNVLNRKKVFDKAFAVLLYAGLAEIVYGIYQVIAGCLRWLFNLDIPVGDLGVIHVDYIGAPWGRPYGSFVEPDWYGTIAMFYALIFMYFFFSGSRYRRRLVSIGLFLSLVGLFFSFVRAAWVGFFAGALAFLILKKWDAFSKISFRLYVRLAGGLTICLALVTVSVPAIRNTLRERINPTYDTNAQLSMNNARVLMMKDSLAATARHPLIGNGPGSAAFNYLATEMGENRAQEHIKNDEALKGKEGFDPSIIFTVLEDTGLIGLLLFLWLQLSIFMYNVRNYERMDGQYRMFAIALLGAWIGLMTSYVFSQGFWIPFTWVFLAFNIAAVRLARAPETVAA